jgi:hypothetical protein
MQIFMYKLKSGARYKKEKPSKRELNSKEKKWGSESETRYRPRR